MHKIPLTGSVLATLAAATLLAACGQKGPLTLPEKQSGDVVTRPAQTPANDDADKKKSEADKQP